ncbi:MAG: AI-2E family transporter [Cellulosilyticaceae bacterium]
MEHMKKYREEIRRGAFWVFVGTLLFITYQLVQNGTFVLGSIGNVIAHFVDVISPILWAFALAYLLYYPVRGIQKLLIKGYEKLAKKELGARGYGTTRVLSIVIVLFIVIYLIKLMILFIFPPLIENIESLIHGLPAFSERVSVWLNQLTNFVGTFQIDWNLVWDRSIEMMKSALGTGLQLLVSSLTAAIGSISSFVVDFVVTVILTFYFLKDKEKIFAALNKFFTIIFKESTLHHIKGFLKDLDDVVGKFLVGTIFASTVVGIISSVLMLLIKHPFAVLVGVVAGITNVIPYVGPLIGALLALVLGIFQSVQIGVLGFVLLIIYQQIDGNIIQPKIVGESVGVAPVWILMSVLIGGSYFGGIGMIISVPIAALVSVYIERIYQKKIRR